MQCLVVGDSHVPAVTVHNFTVQITQNNLQKVQRMRQSMGAAKFLQSVRVNAVALSGYVAPLPAHAAFSTLPPPAEVTVTPWARSFQPVHVHA